MKSRTRRRRPFARISFLGPVLVFVALLGALWLEAIRDQREWEEFSREHDCELYSRERQVWRSTKDCYVCDDGVEYCR